MRYVKLLGLSGLLAATLLSTRVRAEETADDAGDAHNTEQPKEAEAPAPPAATVAQPATPMPAPPAGPKFGDVSTSGYFRGAFGASNQKGRMTCFSLALPGGLVSKYRLGNECEVWSETHFTVVTYVGADGSVASMHFMPTVYIPTTYIGYSPTSATNSPAAFTTSTGATLSFPNLYADIKGIPALAGGTAWIGNRYYKRESIYISDFFYWNPSGVGAGIEDINVGGKDARLSAAVFAVDGEPAPAGPAPAPSLPAQSDFGLRADVQLRGIRPYDSGEFQFGFQYIANLSNNPDTHSGYGGTIQFVQKLLGGDNKLAFQYGRGGGTGFGTLARFYYPDFSVRHGANEVRYRGVDVFTIQPTAWLGSQVGLVYQHDNLGTPGTKTDWYSAGGRLVVGVSTHFKVAGEAGFDRVKKDNGSDPQWLAKFTIAPTLAAAGGLMGRPELRLFYTWATWNAAAQTATIDSGRLYTDTYPNYRSGATFGLQAETWW